MQKPAVTDTDSRTARSTREVNERAAGTMYAFVAVEELRRALGELAAIELVRMVMMEALEPTESTSAVLG